MRVPRIHITHPLNEAQPVALADKGIKHIKDVLRLTVGNRVILFNGDGYDYQGEIVELHKRSAVIQLGARKKIQCESHLHLHLLQPLCRSEKMDWCLQKATELGVQTITPYISSRVNLNLPSSKVEKKLAHWQAVIHSACEQSGRAEIPTISAAQDFAKVVSSLPDGATKIIASPTADVQPLANEKNTHCICAVGPEGGFTDEEIQLAEQSGFVSHRLGPRILRLETAVISILTLYQAHCGDLS